jgi:mono/diheme cytochrome c family protein
MSARVAILAVALAGACSSPTGGPGAPVAVDPAALYNANCARCHGADGRGKALRASLPALRDLTAAETHARSTEDLERVIMGGRNQMPGFGAQLSQPKIQALAGYVRRLGAR